MDDQPDEIVSLSQAAEALRLANGQEPVLTHDDRACLETAEENARALVAAAKVEPQFVSIDERKRLHDILDALLNEREYLEKWSEQAHTIIGIQLLQRGVFPARDLHRNASKLLVQLLGEEVRSMALLYGQTGLDSFAETARLLLPAFSQPKPKSLKMQMLSEFADSFPDPEEIIDDLVGVVEGDEPRTFQIVRRNKGQPMRPYRIAKLKCRALYWEKLLKKMEHPTKTRHDIISDAFRTDFETIRKWKYSALKVLGERNFEMEVSIQDTAPNQYEKAIDYFVSEIKNDGEKYWNEKCNLSNLEKITE